MNNDPEQTITALTSDTTNKHLIVGNNRGQVTVWLIESYARFRRYSDLVLAEVIILLLLLFILQFHY